jgi:DNA-binding MarR family transcriptional regulator
MRSGTRQKRSLTLALDRTAGASHGEACASVILLRSKARGRSGPSQSTQPVGGLRWVHVRRGAEEPFLAQLALVGAAGQGGVRLARGTAFDARERDVVFQAVFSSGLPDDLRCFIIVSNETIVKEWFQVKRSGSFDLESFLPYRLSVTTNRVSRAFAAQYEQEFGISIPEWRAIAVLGAFAPLSSNEICERTAMDKAKVSRAVATLLKRGLIEREAHETDQRLIQLTLSKAGRKIYEAIIPRARPSKRK